MDSNNSSNIYGYGCIHEYKPWIRTTDVQINFAFYISLCVLSIAVALMATLSNILLIAVILTTPNLKTPSYSLIASQSFGDLLMALYIIMLSSFIVLGMSEITSRATCYVWQLFVFLSRMAAWVSVFSSTLLSIDRYLAMYLGMRYKAIVTVKRVHIAVLMVWISGPVVCIILHLFLQRLVQTATVYAILGNLYFSTTSYFYFNAFRLLRRHSKSSPNSGNITANATGRNQPDVRSTSARLEWNKYRKSIWTLVIVDAVFVIISLPVLGAWVNLFIKRDSSNNTDRLFLAFACLIWAFGSVVNPGIHICRMNDVRQACRSVLVKLRSRMNISF